MEAKHREESNSGFSERYHQQHFKIPYVYEA